MMPRARRHLVDGPWGAALLLLAHFALLVGSARHDSLTFDEPLFLLGGLASWRGEARFYPEGGDLTQRLEALPLLSRIEVPEDRDAWLRSDGHALAWRLAAEHGRELEAGRWSAMAASLLLALTTYVLARRLLGPAAALLALSLHALSPLMVAQGHLATADCLGALTLLWASALVGRCMTVLTPATLALSLLATSAALLAKFTGLLVLPIAAVIVAARLVAGAPVELRLRGSGAGATRVLRSRFAVGAAAAGLAAVHAAVAVLAVWAVYGFRFAAIPEGAPPETVLREGGWEAVEGSGPVAAGVERARELRLLPEPWLLGIQFTSKWAENRRAYADGRYSLRGWWWFFPRALALKMPIGALLLLPLGLVAFAGAWSRGEALVRTAVAPGVRGDLVELLPLLSLGLVYGGVALGARLNIGARHLLPLLPLLFMAGGAAARLAPAARATGASVRAGSRARAVIAVLAVVAAVEGLSAHPNQLAWMNAGAGPPSQRWRRLVDSSLDWGQGLREAGRFLATEQGPAFLAYFGTIPPESEGVQAAGLHGFTDRWRRPDGSLPGGGTYVVSATVLVQLLPRVCPGPWRPLYEQAWRRSEQRVAEARAAGSAVDAATLAEHDELLTGRLCAYLRQREPDAAIAGGAMLLYRLSDDDVREALFGPPAELVDPAAMPVPFPLVPYPGAPGLGIESR